jgi:hypothetical protein
LSLQLDLDFESLLGEKMYVFTVCVFVVLWWQKALWLNFRRRSVDNL